MATKSIYPSYFNPFLIKTDRPLPDEIAVIGAGHIGPDIAYYLRTGLPDKKLYLVDIVEDQLKKAKERHLEYTDKGIKKGKITPDLADKILCNTVYTGDYEDIKNCELVIEAATENLPVKHKIFEMLEDVTSNDAILTSNTSGIPAHQIFSDLKHPERTTITHFFAPAWRSLPVEVVNWEGAPPELLSYLLWFFASTGKIPMVTADVYSFLLNRIFENWCNEAVSLLARATSTQVDHVAEELVASGPFFVMNFTGGNPIVYESQKRMMEEGECYKPSRLLMSVDTWKVNRPGTKTDVADDLREWIKDRLLGRIFSQCFDIADREIGTRFDLNLGSIVGLAFKKGVYEVMADLGENEVNRIIKTFGKECPGFPRSKKSIEKYTEFPKDILVDDMGGVRIITIQRPHTANSISARTCDEIIRELKRGEKDLSVKGFIITAYGTGSFCSGADINGLIPVIGNYSSAVALSRDYSEVVQHINSMDKPVVAAVNGYAIGGGMELAMSCHSIVADGKAFFKLPEITLGIFPGMGGAIVPYRKWPKAAKKIHEIVLEGLKLTCTEAEELGIVNRITDSYTDMVEAAIEEVNNLSGRIPVITEGPVAIPDFSVPEEPRSGDMILSKEALAILTRVIKEGAAANSFEEAMEISFKGFGEISCIDSAREGISAFLEKRRPNFRK